MNDAGQASGPGAERATIGTSTVGPRPSCRFCAATLHHTFVDLGLSPLCESYVPRERLGEMEPFYPLRAYVCAGCFLVQVEALVSGESIFGGEYAYFSSHSDSWLEHAAAYTEMIVERLGLDRSSRVIELASNDGYLLRNFVARGIPAQGVEPAANVAEVARARGVPTRVEFFGTQTAVDLAASGAIADLLVANNVLAHVPDLNDFVCGMRRVLAPTGVITAEFPHLERLIEETQFDTIYQEHYCYFSLFTVQQIFAAHGLTIFDVDELETHGGSLRIYARRDDVDTPPTDAGVERLIAREIAGGVDDLETYRAFAARVVEAKWKLLECLIRIRRAGKRIAGYGAPGKGNTLLNYCGIRGDFLDYVVDRNPYKHGKFLPGTRIPIFDTNKIAETRPDYILVLPWNLRREIMSQLDYVRDWGAKFIVPIPEVSIHR